MFKKKLVTLIILVVAVVMVFSGCEGVTIKISLPDFISDELLTDSENNNNTISREEEENDTNLPLDNTPDDDIKNQKDTFEDAENFDNDNVVSKNNNGTYNNSSAFTESYEEKTDDEKSEESASLKSSDVPEENTVRVLMWRDYTSSELQQIVNFQKKTGIRITTTFTTEKEYESKLISLISMGDSPDVVCLSTSNFPKRVINSLQPVNKKAFSLDDRIWQKEYMNNYRVGNKYFGVAIRGGWNCEDTNYVTYYSPSLLRSIGVTKTPYQLYKEGNWNFDTQYDIIQKATAVGKFGISMQSKDVYALAAGADMVEYDPDKAVFKSNLENLSESSALVTAWTKYQEMAVSNSKAATNWNLQGFIKGNGALFCGIAWGMYNQGEWFDALTANKLEAVPVAGPRGKTAYTPTNFKAWGTAKGAENPEGAAKFLRYFLDPSTVNMSSTFNNKQFEAVFNIISGKNVKKQAMFGTIVVSYQANNAYTSIINTLANSSPCTAKGILNQNKYVVNSAVTSLNKDIAHITD